MASYIATMLDTETFEVVTTVVIEAESDEEAFIEAEKIAEADGYAYGDLFLRG